ncbi:purine-nucleoside phosphorylase [Colwellia sp. 75C3]|uniref:purine-nucleoside phosphorylase n=1 Tax=Colwellia sp. 75C3 TaxID=888425 RepID=UPI000C32FC4D|nr:purine-nucleoside phosphorylase [Colwellia sp. 75C3]PKG82002.1 purine-nucleoside phosphorylase [Colwellia sp. 75C3]
MPTAHISAHAGDFAETVIMPGDPLRAQFIAENYLTNVKQVTAVRNMFGYTGEYKGKRISVMGSGMGIPSMSIYATELYRDYGVENIIRVGSCGSIRDDIQLEDIVIAMGASTDSNVNRQRLNNFDFAAIANYELLEKVVTTAKRLGKTPKVGNVFSADLFYVPEFEVFEKLEKYGILAVEMEAAGLYGVAAELGKKALCLLTVSDHIKSGEKMSAEDRQLKFGEMIEMTLESIV